MVTTGLNPLAITEKRGWLAPERISVHSGIWGTLGVLGKVRVRKEVGHWIPGVREAHTQLVPLMGSGVEVTAVGCIDSGRRNRKGGFLRTVVQREDIIESLETNLGD